MAENQTASEDAGQQSLYQSTNNQQHNQLQQIEHNQPPTNQQQEQQQQQLLLPTLEEALPALISLQENSALSTEDAQTAFLVKNLLPMNSQQQSKQQDDGLRGNMMDHQIANKFKQTQRRNATQTTSRTPSNHTIRKMPLSKITSLTDNVGIGENSGSATSVVSKHQSNLHYHHNHATSNSTVARTTSESLRLHALPKSNNDTISASMSNVTSSYTLNPSSSTRLTNSSSSSSIAPRSTPNTYASQSLSSETISLNNNNKKNNSVGVCSSANTSRSHHSHGHVHTHGVGTLLQRKPKTTSSFQITSITVGQAKKSSDNGEESADDLDDSHTDDNSHITDLENDTPSMSEDTLSKDEFFYANSVLNSTAPVIPTSSQYGLVVVDPIGPTLGQIQNVQVNVADNIINVVSGSKKKEDLKETQHRSERFKVVKIESTEPFRRGRWMCMDYLDHSTVGNNGKDSGHNNEKIPATETIIGSGDPTKTTQSMIIGPGAAALLENHADTAGNSLKLTGANMPDEKWNFATGNAGIALEGTSSSHLQQINIPSGIATAPATMAPGHPNAQAFLNSIEQEQLQQQSQVNHTYDTQSPFDQKQQAYNEPVIANSASTGQEPAVRFAAAAAKQLKRSLEQLKHQEEAVAAAEAVVAHMYVPDQSQPINFAHMQQQSSSSSPIPKQSVQPLRTTTTIPNNLHFKNDSNGVSIPTDSNRTSPSSQQQAAQLQHEEKSLQQKQAPLHSRQLSMQQMTYAEVAQQNAQQMQQQTQSEFNVISQQPAATTYIPQQHQQTRSQQQMIYDDMSMQQQQHQKTHVTTVQSNAVVVPQALQQALSQPDGIAPSTILQQAQNQQQQTQLLPQYQHSTQGQTIPVMTQVPAYDVQSQQQQQQQQLKALSMQQPPTQMQSAPVTLADTNVLMATLQAVQHQKSIGLENVIGQIITGVIPVSKNHTTANLAANDLQQQQRQQNMNVNNGNHINISGVVNVRNIINANASSTLTNNGDDLLSQQQHQALQTLQTNMEMETESASGTSAVAIDNKIEQAMDLVKSHLMIAVREEVEVLKEKISELLDKINQLEVENSLLKSNMSQETLQKLQVQTQFQISGSETTPGIQAVPTETTNNNATNITNGANMAVVSVSNVAAPSSLNNSETNSAFGTGALTATSTPTSIAVDNTLTTTEVVSGITEADNDGAVATMTATVTTDNERLS